MTGRHRAPLAALPLLLLACGAPQRGDAPPAGVAGAGRPAPLDDAGRPAGAPVLSGDAPATPLDGPATPLDGPAAPLAVPAAPLDAPAGGEVGGGVGTGPEPRTSAPHAGAERAADEDGGAQADATPPAVQAPLPHDDARRRALAERLAGELPGWNLYESPCWFLATPVDDPLLVEGARERLEAVRARLHRELPPRRVDAHREKPLVRLHPSREAYAAAGAPQSSTGYWDPQARELVAYDAGGARAETTWPALQHMAVHAHLDAELGLAATPPWLLYGVGARYEGLRLRELRSGGRALLPRPASEEAALLRAALGETAPPPLDELFDPDREAFLATDARGLSAYRRLRLASAFVAFLEDPEPCGDGAVDARRAGFLARYLSALQDGAGPEAGLERALGPISPAQLEAAWRSFLEARLGIGRRGP